MAQKSGAAAAGPYLSALIDDIDYAAREMAFVAQGGRLDPPLSLIVDEIANLSPWPGVAGGALRRGRDRHLHDGCAPIPVSGTVRLVHR